jgi:ABC-type uncharacterized transport system auxiliary subunit
VSGRAIQRTVVGGLLAGVLLSCVHGTLPPRELYRLLPLDSAAATHARARDSASDAPVLDGALQVEPYQTPGLYGDPAIVYRVGETQYGTYSSREWAIPLSNMLATLTVDVLRATSFAAGPVVSEAAADNGARYKWRGTVREFEEVNRGRQLLAAVHLDASIVRARDDSLLWHGSARIERGVSEPTMSAIVAALSALADSAVAELAQQAGRAFQGRSAAAAPDTSKPR